MEEVEERRVLYAALRARCPVAELRLRFGPECVNAADICAVWEALKSNTREYKHSWTTYITWVMAVARWLYDDCASNVRKQHRYVNVLGYVIENRRRFPAVPLVDFLVKRGASLRWSQDWLRDCASGTMSVDLCKRLLDAGAMIVKPATPHEETVRSWYLARRVCQRACRVWLALCRRPALTVMRRCVNRDVSRVVAELVWARRFDAAVWPPPIEAIKKARH